MQNNIQTTPEISDCLTRAIYERVNPQKLLPPKHLPDLRKVIKLVLQHQLYQSVLRLFSQLWGQLITKQLREGRRVDPWVDRVVADYYRALEKDRDETEILNKVDPAIRPIISRLLQLPALTVFSCSGHLQEIETEGWTNPYLVIIFLNQDFGQQFIEKVYQTFRPQMFKIQIQGLRNLPIDLALKGLGKISFRVQPHKYKDPTWQLPDLWVRWSEVLDHFDQQGLYIPEIQLFN